MKFALFAATVAYTMIALVAASPTPQLPALPNLGGVVGGLPVVGPVAGGLPVVGPIVAPPAPAPAPAGGATIGPTTGRPPATGPTTGRPPTTPPRLGSAGSCGVGDASTRAIIV
ncbi:hypothetical protein AGABI2DRAFT_189193 [Agaricus bisporus var. bisporus H97]|uniref:hypothetical protein n=1 Tax=Agaricus bisporus var. bisporus (strain H97 / ATCC MYA-4626 / FGSC 10389) TaxID=936046 RepID=UPI00029F6C3B|nr:hypothetical protein AGABI2DRAFT_189193 [Agaricus bisporus var. bisporus H97]EKV50848.1 hypothetical protein AGABI2DRAFT_189193 [Agaricus bisporus var. bisporus H97]